MVISKKHKNSNGCESRAKRYAWVPMGASAALLQLITVQNARC